MARKGDAQPVVAVVNSSEDIVNLIRQLLEEEGFATVVGHVPSFKTGRDDLVAFLQTHDPAVVVYDLAPPYEQNWAFLRLVRDARSAEGRAFVLTTTNRAQLTKAVPEAEALEIVGKPFDLAAVVAAVKKGLEGVR